jgi:hypothetical protein
MCELSLYVSWNFILYVLYMFLAHGVALFLEY